MLNSHDVEDMVRLVVGQMDEQDVEASVNGLDEAEPPCQGVQGTQAAVAEATDTTRSFIVDVGGRKHGAGAAAEVGPVESSVDAALAVVQPSP